jgi:hypothetical protein
MSLVGSRWRVAALVIIVVVGGMGVVTLGGCGPNVEKRACMTTGSADPLVVDALVFRLDIYGAGVRCEGASVVAGSGAPLMSHTYERGQTIQLDVPPGPHALELTTYSDAGAQHVLGYGCTVTTLSAGAQICFDLTLSPASDGGLPSSGDDMGPGGAACSASAQCSATNDAGASTEQCCANVCTNVASAVDDCGGCNMACSTSHIARHCSGGACDGTCLAGYGDCNGDKRSDGCESALDTVTNCGACGTSCNTANSMGASCAGSACTYTGCSAGAIDCNSAAPNTNGCECATATTAAQGTPGCCGTQCQTKHDNGIGQNFYDCAAAGTFNGTEAEAACVAKTGSKSKCFSFSCNDANTYVYCDVNCGSGHCPACNCWGYAVGNAAGNPGHVNTDCYCPSAGDPAWN